jgi:hypothetical protein
MRPLHSVAPSVPSLKGVESNAVNRPGAPNGHTPPPVARTQDAPSVVTARPVAPTGAAVETRSVQNSMAEAALAHMISHIATTSVASEPAPAPPRNGQNGELVLADYDYTELSRLVTP